jgi:hypothetical protein
MNHPFCRCSQPLAIAGTIALLCASLLGCKTPLTNPHESAYHSLFDGHSLAGWKLMDRKGGGYGVTNGVIYCARGGGGNLMTEKEYSDFIMRFEFKLQDGSNNGIAIRAPLEGDAAYLGMEIQILDEGAADRGKWGKLRPEQYHGSIYGVVAAQKGALRPPGEWNTEEITAQGRRIKVVVNGTTILETDLNDLNDPYRIAKHPGLFRDRGHIGLLGHDDYIEFRHLRIKELSTVNREGTPPEGFTSLFNGQDLGGWKGLVADPIKRAALPPAALADAQAKADAIMRADWKVEEGALVYRGTNFDNLCTTKDFVNFELLADWKIETYADSGIYLRGTPQVQIWDPFTQPTKAGSEVGSGGLYNNTTNSSRPLLVADKPIGEWNRFRIIMAGDIVHVFLNGELVVNGTPLENYWQRDLSVFPFGSIELQAHNSVVWFKNIYVRDLHQPAK